MRTHTLKLEWEWRDAGNSLLPTMPRKHMMTAVRCAIVTKNDHTIISDRSQDIILPVTFTGEAPPLPSSTTAAPSDDTVTEITVSPGVEDLTGVATSNDSGLGWAPIVIGLGVLAVLSSIIIVSVRKTSAR
jgi:hypothetical protein